MRYGILAVAAALVLGAGVAQAQGEGRRAQNTRIAPREELFKMVDAYIVSNLQESLGLNDEQFVKLLPLVKRLQDDRRRVVRARFEALSELRRVLQSGSATDARVADLLRMLKTAEIDEPAVIRKDVDAIDAVLTPLQQAKYRVLEVEVERRLREMMSQVRRDAPDARPGRRNEGGPPAQD